MKAINIGCAFAAVSGLMALFGPPVLPAAAGAIGPAAQNQGNLLKNPSFEMGGKGAIGGLPQHWIKGSLSQQGVNGSADSKSTATVVGGGRTGKYAAMLILDRSDQWVLLDQRVETDLAKGDQYLFSVWLKADTPITVSMALIAQCPSLGKVYEQHVECRLTRRWQEFEVGVTISPKVGDPTRISRLPGSAGQYLRGIVQVRQPGVKVHIDDARLTRVAAGTVPIKRVLVADAPAKPGGAAASSKKRGEVAVLVELPGVWLFRKDRDKVGEKEKWFGPGKKGADWKPLTTRTFWPEYFGDGWYAVDVVIPSAGHEKVWLVFGAVDENYTLWINGKYIGDNLDAPGEEVWDKPVAEEITGQYQPDQSNHIVVRVKNVAGGGGIWKPVYVVKGPVGKLPKRERLGPPGKAKWLEPSDELVTPHIPWAKPSVQGPLKVLFITYRLGMREVVEICQRFDIEREVFAIELPRRFSGGVESGQYDAFPGTRPEDQQRRLREKLSLDYDCIVIGNIPWKVLPKWARTSILKKVEKGTGLVGYINGELDGALKSATSNKLRIDRDEVLGAYPFKGLPAFRKYAAADDFARETLNLAQHGKGRIALLKGYDCPTYQMLAPAITTPFTEWHMVHYDYYLAMAGRVMQWAAKRRGDVLIREPGKPVLEVDREELSGIRFALKAKARTSVDLEFALRRAESGEVIEGVKRQAALEASENQITFAVPPVSAGAYFADLWVRTDGKTVTSGSLFVKVTSKSGIAEVVLDGKGFKAGDRIKHYSRQDPITGRVNVKGARKGLTVEVRHRDNYGRLLALERYPVAGEAVKFSLAPLPPRSVLQWIDVRLLDGDVVLDARGESFTYNDLFPPEPGEDVYYVLWEGYQGETYLNTHLYKVIRDAGFDMVWTQFCFDEKLRSAGAALRANLYEFPSLHYPSPVRPRIWGDPIPAEGGGYIRKPCLTDPKIMKIVADTYAKAARTAGKYSTPYYHLGSETELTSRDPGREVCFSPTCIRHFRDYLKREYGTINALNTEYATHHTDWNEIVPVEFTTAIKTGQIPLWIDFRRNMETVWANFFVRASNTISKVVPKAKVGTEAADDPGHHPRLGGLAGDDWWKLAKAQSLNIPYFYPPQLDALRDFVELGTLTGTTYGGYTGVFRAERKGDWHRWIVWYTLLRYRLNSFHVWQGSGMQGGEIVGTTIAPDFTWYDFMTESHRAVSEIQDGIGKLLLAMDRPDDGIAVLYSPASLLMANLIRELPQRLDSFAAVSVIFPEADFQYRIISSDELEAGILKKRGFKAVYLPYCQALSPKEVEEIRGFVKAGGAVVADLRPGVADAHGKPYAKGALDDVFGVKQDTRDASPTLGFVGLREPVGPLKGKLPQAGTDASLRLAGGKALASVADAPAVVVNDHGAGKAILLNFAICDYVLDKLMRASHTAIRFVDNETAMKTAALIQGLFAKAGLTPEVELTPHVPGCHLYRFNSGDARIMGLLWDIPPFLPGIGPLPMKDLDEISATWSRRVTLQLDSPRHVYDVLGRKYLGLMREIPRTVRPGPVHILATLPYKVESISLALMKKSFKRGEKLSFSAAVKTSGPPAGLHVLRIEFTDPEGKPAKMYTLKLIAKAGKCAGNIGLGLNEKLGDWTITARDTASGVSTEATVQITGK